MSVTAKSCLAVWHKTKANVGKARGLGSWVFLKKTSVSSWVTRHVGLKASLSCLLVLWFYTQGSVTITATCEPIPQSEKGLCAVKPICLLGSMEPELVLWRRLRKPPSHLDTGSLVRFPHSLQEKEVWVLLRTASWRHLLNRQPSPCVTWDLQSHLDRSSLWCQDWCGAGLLSNMPPKLNLTDPSSVGQAVRGVHCLVIFSFPN